MKIKEFLKKAAVATMSLTVALSSAAFIPQEASIVRAADPTMNVVADTSSYIVDLNSASSGAIANYYGGDDTSSTIAYYIVIANTADSSYYSSADTTSYDFVQGLYNGNYSGVYYRTRVSAGSSGTIKLSDTSINTSGTYQIYYCNSTTGSSCYSARFRVDDTRGSSSNNNSGTSSGPQISSRSIKRYGYGVDFIFRVTNETCDYEWHIYDRVPSSNNKQEFDSGSGYTSDKKDDITISTNNLDKNTTYYLSLKVTGDSTKRTNYYSDNGTSTNTNSYYTFKTVNSDTWASGTSGTSSSSSSSNSNSTKKNSDGTTTTTSTTTQDGMKTKTEKTTGYSDGHEYTYVTATPTSSSADWKSSESKYTKLSDGSSEQFMTTIMKDGSKILMEAKTTSLGTTTMVTGNYSSANVITGLKTEILNDSNTEILQIDYKVGTSENVAVKKITGKKTTVTIPDSVSVNNTEYTVTSVADNAFKSNTSVTKLVIPDSVTKVGKNAFKNNKKLKTIVINNPLSSVGTNAFKGIHKNAVIKIDAGASAYKKTVKKIQKAGVASTVKFKNI
ncbi:MAG: leucine-rich repeat domain-containing protein [Lachnospiraceae bacterium]|nr:leucine-rich repeat domain-containing protein [Lachnospiraceae bacterium]